MAAQQSVLTTVHTHIVYKKTAEERHIYSYSISILAVSIFDQHKRVETWKEFLM